MKEYIIVNKTVEVERCTCGSYPKFIQPDIYHTDIWLRCPTCGRETPNTGGYHYAEEIPLEIAKQKAAEIWNQMVRTSEYGGGEYY